MTAIAPAALPPDIAPQTVELAREIGLCDLHIDTLIPPRLWGYDPRQAHTPGLLGGRFFGHLDLPRLLANGVAAAQWSITTNPFRSARGRWHTWRANRQLFDDWVVGCGQAVQVVRTPVDLAAAKTAGRHGILCAVQGANAWQAALSADPTLDSVLADGTVMRATVVHLTDSALGATSSPLSLRRDKRLTALGAQVVGALNRHRAFVDLAHAHPQTFWDALACSDRDQPPIATHTGVSGVRAHWRNLDDRQIVAIADRGGVVGIVAASLYLRPSGRPDHVDLIVDHLAHTIAVGGEACAAIGTDLDGAIVPPPGMRDGFGHLRVLAAMVRRGWSHARIERVCWTNFAQCFDRLRPVPWRPSKSGEV